jgi:hypothetical protein
MTNVEPDDYASILAEARRRGYVVSAEPWARGYAAGYRAAQAEQGNHENTEDGS